MADKASNRTGVSRAALSSMYAESAPLHFDPDAFPAVAAQMVAHAQLGSREIGRNPSPLQCDPVEQGVVADDGVVEVAIARALAAEPEAILYDEPTTMVDPLMAQTIGDLILKLKRETGLTSLVVTHDMRLARKLADRVVFLVDSRVAFFGSIIEMDQSTEPMVREFIELDEVSFLK